MRPQHVGINKHSANRGRHQRFVGTQGSLHCLNHLVSDSVDVVVHTERGPDGPRVSGIIAVEDLVAGPESMQFTVTDVFGREAGDDELTWSGLVPVRAAERMATRGIDLRALLEESDR